MTPENFYRHRKALGLKRTGMANALGSSRTTVAAYEDGRSPVPQYIALAIGALLYGLPPAP